MLNSMKPNTTTHTRCLQAQKTQKTTKNNQIKQQHTQPHPSTAKQEILLDLPLPLWLGMSFPYRNNPVPYCHNKLICFRCGKLAFKHFNDKRIVRLQTTYTRRSINMMKKLKTTATLFIIALIILSTWSITLKTQAAAPGNHIFSLTFPPTTVDVSQTVQFTVQITNDPNSQNNIGSINLTTPLGFTVTTHPTITSPTGTWITNVQNEAKIGMKPSSPQETMPPGQTLTITFYATTPSLPGSSTWTTECNTNPGFGGIPFNLPARAQQPVIATSSALVTPSLNALPAIIDQG